MLQSLSWEQSLLHSICSINTNCQCLDRSLSFSKHSAKFSLLTDSLSWKQSPTYNSRSAHYDRILYVIEMFHSITQGKRTSSLEETQMGDLFLLFPWNWQQNEKIQILAPAPCCLHPPEGLLTTLYNSVEPAAPGALLWLMGTVDARGIPAGSFYFFLTLRTLLDHRGWVGTRGVCHGSAASQS